MDPTEMGIIFSENTNEISQKIRDLLNQCIIKSDTNHTYILLGLENQSEIHYSMAVKNMIYDAMNYGKQVTAIGKKHREEKVSKGAEFLSGFMKTDRLKPIITLTIYWGEKKWDAHRSLHEMFGTVDKNLLKYVNNYKINLIVPNEIDDFNKFSTELGPALKFISVSKKASEMKKIKTDKTFESISNETVRLLNICTNSKIKLNEKEGGMINMCEALEEIRTEGVEEGRKEGVITTRLDIVKKMLALGYSDKEIITITDINQTQLDFIYAGNKKQLPVFCHADEVYSE